MWDWTDCGALIAQVVADNSQSITLRRGATTLAAQSVRIARVGGSGRTAQSAEAQESKGRVVIVGSTSLDIEPGDRFTDSAGVLYTVVIVRPNRRAAVIAEAEVIE